MNTKTTQPKAVMYLRARSLGTGDDRAVEDHAIDQQRRECEQVAAALDAQLVREYVERGGTGSVGKRPELRLMLDELRMLRDVQYVIATSPDRLWRQTADHAAIQFEIDAAGAQLVFAHDVLGHPPQPRKEVSI